jgi:hypothetical protein
MTSAASASVGLGAAPGIAAGGCVPGRGALLVEGRLLRTGACPGRYAEVVPEPRMRFATVVVSSFLMGLGPRMRDGPTGREG